MKKFIILIMALSICSVGCAATVYYPLQYDADGNIVGWETVRDVNRIVDVDMLTDTNDALQASIDLKQDAITAATDIELSATSAVLQAAIDLKQDALTAATDVELSATGAVLQAAIDLKQDALTAATDVELTNAVNLLEDAIESTGSVLIASIEDLSTNVVLKGEMTGDLEFGATGDIELTATGLASIHGGTNNVGGVSLQDDEAVLFTRFDNPDTEDPLNHYSGVLVDSDGNIKMYWPYEVIPGSWGIKEHVFGSNTNYFSTPVGVGNATMPNQALNQTVADGLYVQPHTDGDLELTASGTGFIYGGTNNYGGVSLKEEQAVLFTVFDNPDPDFPFDQYSGVYVDSDGNIKLYWPYEVVPGSWGIKEHVFGALTNSFSTPVTVGNATNETQALNQTVADGLYVQPDDLVSARSTIIGLLNNMDAEVITVLQGDAAGIVFYRVGYDGTHYVYDDRNVDLDGRGNRRIYYSNGYWIADRVGYSGGSKQRRLWHEMVPEPKTPPISGWESVNFSLGPDPIINPISGDFIAKSYRWSADIDALGSAAHASTKDFATAAQGVLAGSAVQPEDSKLAGARSVGAYDSISIGFNADAAMGGTSLGSKTESGMSSVAVGMQAVAPERYGVSIGYDSLALEEGIAIGKNASATTNAIQLGEGNNTFPGTLQIYDFPFFDFVSWELYPDIIDTFASNLGSAAWSDSTDFAAASITNDLGVVAESVLNLSYVVNPSLWGLSINGDLEPMGVSAGLLDDGVFAIDLSTGDLMIAGNQSTRFWQVSGSDIYPEVN